MSLKSLSRVCNIFNYQFKEKNHICHYEITRLIVNKNRNITKEKKSRIPKRSTSIRENLSIKVYNVYKK